MFSNFKIFDSPTKAFLMASFLMGLTNGLFDAVYNFYLAARGIDKTQTGYIYAASMLMMASALIPFILLSRKLSQTRLLMFGAFLFALPLLALPFLTSVVANAFTLGLMSSGMIALLSLGNALTGAHVPQHQRTVLFSGFFIAYLGAAMLGSFFVSILMRYSGLSPMANYQLVILLAFTASLFMIFYRRASIQGLSVAYTKSANSSQPTPIEWRNFALLFTAAAMLGGSITLVFRFLNIVLNLAYQLNVSDIALVMGLDKIVSIIGAIMAPILVKRLSIKHTVIFIGALTFICIYIQSLHLTLLVFVIFHFLRLFLNYSLMPLLDTLAITGFNSNRTLLATSVRQLAFYLGGALSALLFGYLLELGRWQTTLLCAASMAFVGAILLTFITEKKENPL
jgi:MFS family permease